MKFDIGMATNPGQKRRGVNQDYIGLVKPGWFNHRPILVAIADGIGGYKGGEIASRTVVRSLLDHYRSWRTKGGYDKILLEGICKAHRQVINIANRNKETKSMGTTLVAAVLDDNKITVVNVGDSRAYNIHNGDLVQISHDHSAVANLERNGEITQEELMNHPNRSMLTMSISALRTEVLPTIEHVSLVSDDYLLLCSDGLWSVVPQEEILYYIQNFAPQEAADDLIAQANAYGGPDNISVIIAHCTS